MAVSSLCSLSCQKVNLYPIMSEYFLECLQSLHLVCVLLSTAIPTSLYHCQVALEFYFSKPRTYIITFDIHSVFADNVISQEECHLSPRLGMPAIQVAEPLNGHKYDQITKNYTMCRLSGNISRLKNLMFEFPNSSIDFRILELIFNSSYRWLVREPNHFRRSISNLKKAVRLCQNQHCRNSSLLRAKAQIFLAQNLQSESGKVGRYKKAQKYIDEAKVSIYYVGPCMERSALACQEALWHAAQCSGNMPMETKSKIGELLEYAIDCASQLKTYEGMCFLAYNHINMARLYLCQFYPVSQGRHQQETAMDPTVSAEDLRKAKSHLDCIPEEFLTDSSALLYKAFY